MSAKLSIKSLNTISADEFKDIFSNVIENWPQAAKEISSLRPFKNTIQLAMEFDNYLNNIDTESKEMILKYHPDLAGKLAVAGKLTKESSEEQATAGLNSISSEQRQELNEMNEKYKTKFKFPFVVCVRETNKFEAILREMTSRIRNDSKEELNTGISEVKKICRLRIGQIVDL